MRRNGLQYTLITDAGTLTINPTSFSGDGYYLVEPIELDSENEVVAVKRTTVDGSLIGDTTLGGIASGWSVACAAADADDRQTLEDELAEHIGALLTGDGTLKWTDPDATARQLPNVRALGMARPSGTIGLIKVMSFELASPRAHVEGQTQTTTDSDALTTSGGGLSFSSAFPWAFTASGGGSLTVPNAGNAPSRPILEVHGPITTPIVTRVDTQEKLKLDTSIAAGDYIELDLFNRTAKLNGGTSVANTLDVSVSSWFAIPAGGTTVALSGSGATGATLLRSKTRPTWWI
jgi:hypothetical protein